MSDRCNVLYIMTDQQSATAMSCAGNDDLHTPALDQLAEDGTRFEAAYCTYPLCVPARVSMFTGRMPHEVGIEGNGGLVDPSVMPQSLGHLLRGAGYRNAYAGKTHLPVPDDGETGAYWGWETIGPWDDHAVAPACIDFLAQQHDEPFFLVASYDNPHNICQWARQQQLPYGPVEDVPTESCPGLPANYSVPPYESEVIRPLVRSNYSVHPMVDSRPDLWRHYRHAYYRLVERVDAGIGRILNALFDSPYADNTLIVFSSDHGDGQGAHQLNQKSFLYDEQTRVPLIVRPPGGGKPQVATGPVSATLDLLPTVCDYAGVSVPDQARGLSLRPAADRGEDDKDRAVVTETVVYEQEPGRMVRTDRYKYSVYSKGPYREQLFDLYRDPGEMVNLAIEARYQHVLASHREILSRWCEQTDDHVPKRWRP